MPKFINRSRVGLYSLRFLLVVLGILASLIFLEGGLRVYYGYFAPPRYQVLRLAPDPAAGFINVPGLEYFWAGKEMFPTPGCAEFLVNVKINQEGFRDVDHQETRPEGTMRVAFLGDSYVAAIQVPLEQTAAFLLEDQLNQSPPAEFQRVQVLNLGVPGHSLGQSLLVYEEYARKYSPDFVVVLINGLVLSRTANPKITHGIRTRPTFFLEDGILKKVPHDYEQAVQAQAEALETKYAGQRSRRLLPNTLSSYQLENDSTFRERLLAESYLWQQVIFSLGIADASPGEDYFPEFSEANPAILRELDEQTRSDGSQLIVVDMTPTIHPGLITVSRQIAEFSDKSNIPYLPLFVDLEAAVKNGTPVLWPCDRHFNEAGNRVFADALFEWFSANMPN